MIVEKPAWLRHEGLQIFSIDIQRSGHRFATAGGDHKVRIWDMKYLSCTEADVDSAPSKLLATLRDHFGSVNCVRWAKQGHLIASGSDDQIVLVHERRSGSGTTEFGSGEPPDVENWKVLLTLRGHTADVVDLSWCLDDSLLASCSLDNTIQIWNMSNGSQVTVLKGHTSLVKGIAWDPVGSFLASQSDDKSVIVWRASDWNLAQRIEGHWEKTVGSTFFRRLDWSPCGHFITTTNGFQKPRHSAPVLERGVWTVSYDFLGHCAPVVAVKFNHRLFWKQSQMGISDNENGRGETGLANGSSKSAPKDSVPYNVIAMGSQDCSITVWTTTSARPVFVGKHFFTQSVADLSWSPDGYSLFCCSLDGSVAAFHFEVKELGYMYSENEMEELKKNRYGETRGRQTTLAESPAQLLLESVAAKHWGAGEGQSTVKAQPEPPLVTNDAELARLHAIPAPAPAPGPAPAPDVGSEQGSQCAGHAPPTDNQPKLYSPVKQREYRRPDGRRRIIPEPVGPQHRDGRLEMNGFLSAQPVMSVQKRDASNLDNVDTLTAVKDGRKELLPKGGVCAAGKHQVGTATNSIVIEAKMCSMDGAGIGLGPMSLQREVVVNANSQFVKGILSIVVSGKEDAGQELPICFEARPLSSGSTGMNFQMTEVVCSQGGEVKWRDRLMGKATVISGNANMWAVGCQDGTLQVYTKAGRRAMPSMMVGSAPMFMDCTEKSRLLLLTRHGALYMWDCMELRCLLKESVLPLLAMYVESPADIKGFIRIVSIRVSRSGAPLVILANRHVFLFHMDMQCWEQIADDHFHASSFFSSLPGTSPAGDSELASIQVAVAGASISSRKWNRGMNEDKGTTRAHLESQMASAVALKSPQDYQNLLLAYARFLAREADEIRLRELCMELLGPPFPNEVDMDGSDTLLKDMNEWEPTILGLKKQELLKSHVLTAMASNRSVQRLLNEVLDLVSEQETRQQSLGSSTF